jgi:proline iminopeptidase
LTGSARLVIGGYQVFRPRWLGRLADWLGPLIVWIMQARMLRVLKRNVEQASSPPVAQATVGSAR